MKKILLSISLLVMSQLSAQASEEISIFKNGTAFFMKKMNIEPKNNKIVINNLPDAIFGAIWFTTPNNNIKSIISETVNFPESTKITNLAETLRANTGKN